MTTSATYYIAQMVPDLFRREPVNVGVFVFKDGKLAARFFGEKYPGGEIDGRKIKKMPYPGVYMQWVEYWKRVIGRSASPTAELVANNGANYNVIAAGEVDNTDADSPEEIANYLYPLLVSSGGLTEALRESLGLEEEPGAEPVITKLNEAVDDVFGQLDLLADEDAMGFVAHPIIKGKSVVGQRAAHRPSYVQENGKLWVMETVDFTSTRKASARDHAGLAAFMFTDIGDRLSQAKPYSPIAIVKADDVDMEYDDVKYGLEMLKGTAERIVNWNDPAEWRQFVNEREQIAKSNGKP